MARALGHGRDGGVELELHGLFNLLRVARHGLQDGASRIEKPSELCLFRLINRYRKNVR